MATPMPSPDTVDVEQLLGALPGDPPTGASLLFSDVFDEIADARRSSERSQFEPDAKQADWRKVVRLATDAFQHRTKDLQLAVWLTEGLTRMHGFAGLRDGLRLIHELHERYWEDFHPRPDDGELEMRIGRLAWMNDEGAGRDSIAALVRRVPLTPPAAGPPRSWIDWRESRDMDQLARRDPKRHAELVAAAGLTGEQFDAAVAAGSRAFYETLTADAAAALAACARLQATVAARYGSAAPSLYNVHHALEECVMLLESVLAEKRRLEPDPVDEAVDGDGAPSVPAADAAPGPRPSDAVRGGALPRDPLDRADALERLRGVAAFFRRTEPHSPIAYLVERAVRWASLPLEAWLGEVLGNDDHLARVKDVLGIEDRGEGR